MCKFCEEKDCIETYILEVCLDCNNYLRFTPTDTLGNDFTYRIEINFCPMCGAKLKKD